MVHERFNEIITKQKGKMRPRINETCKICTAERYCYCMCVTYFAVDLNLG